MRRVLLDENLPRLLARDLPGFEVCTVAAVGWAGMENGQLLRLAETEFDVFLTADRNLHFQQPVSIFALGFVVLAAGSTKLDDLRRLAPKIEQALGSVQPGQVIYVSSA